MRHTMVVIALIASTALAGLPPEHPFKPKSGFVPNEKTALRIAEAVLEPIYGEEQIRRQRPLTARLDGNIWHVTGTLPEGNYCGGVAEIRLSKISREILRVTHGK